MKNTLKLLALINIAFIVIACTPKKSAEAEAQVAAEKMAQAAVLEAQAQSESGASAFQNTDGETLTKTKETLSYLHR